MDVSIIIVNYNTKDLTQNCLKSVFGQTKDIDFEVIVSDNGSTDGSIDMIKAEFPQVILIENNTNLGFGAANNRGLKISKGKYVFYLNSDTVLLNNAVKIFFDYFEENGERENIGALGGILLDEELRPMHSGADFPTYKFYCDAVAHQIKFHFLKTIIKILGLGNIYQKKRKTVYKDAEIVVGKQRERYITGADLFLLNSDYAFFDESYFMYCEETDLELKLTKDGFSLFIIEGPKIQHLTRKLDRKFSVAKFSDICIQNSAIYYSQKNLGEKATYLKFLIWIDRMNPFVRKTVMQIPKNCIKNKKMGAKQK